MPPCSSHILPFGAEGVVQRRTARCPGFLTAIAVGGCMCSSGGEAGLGDSTYMFQTLLQTVYIGP